MDKLVRKIEVPLAKRAIRNAGLYIVSLYRHYNFELMKEEIIPKTPVTHYAMVRQPQGE